jgi:hypothetical protein
MAFFRKLFTTATVQRFPQFSEFTDAIDALITSGVAIIENDMAGFGDPLKRFCNSQAPDVKKQLEAVHDAGNRQARAMRHFFRDAKGMREGLEPVRLKNDELVTQKAALQASHDQSKASRAAVAKADDALSRADRKGNQVEVRSCLAKLEAARQKAEEDERAAEAKQAEFDQFQARYPNEFINIFATKVMPAVDAKLVELAELEEIGELILDASARFDSYEDSSLERMKKRLEELDAIINE